MTYEEYWEYDPTLINSFIKAEEIRQRKKDQELWLQGMYIYQAIGNLAPLLNPLAKSHKPKKYPEFPFSTPKEEIESAKVEKFKQQLLRLAKEKKYDD